MSKWLVSQSKIGALCISFALPALAGDAGRYVLVRDRQLTQSICEPLTQTLNRKSGDISFDACHPRISSGSERLMRPDWQQIPLDLAIAEEVVKNMFTPVNSEKAALYWQTWLKETEQLRKEQKVKMWRLRVDAASDQPLILVRMNDGQPSKEFGGEESCVYRDSRLYMTEGPPVLLRSFNMRAIAGDVLRDTQTGRWIIIQWSTNPATDSGIWGNSPPTWIRNATRGIAVYEISDYLPAVCNIQWAPANRPPRPVK